MTPEQELLKARLGFVPGSGSQGSDFNVSDWFENLMNRSKVDLEKPGGLLKNKDGNFRRAGGGKRSAALGVLQTTLEDPVAGVVSAPIGIGAGQLANMVTNYATQGMLQGPPPMKIAGMALRYLAPSFVGYQAQQAAARGVQNIAGSAPQAVGGAAQAATGGLFGLGSSLQDLSIFGIPVGGRAIRRAESAYQREERNLDFLANEKQRLAIQKADLANDLAFARASAQIAAEARINEQKATFPMLLNMLREEANIQKTSLNLQTANMQKLARMAGSFQLAERSMAESGALARTLAEKSPYNAAMLPMPQIQFGG